MKTVRYPDGSVLLRDLQRNFPLAARGEGLYLFDTSGKKYIDASGGAFVTSVGHGNSEVLKQITEQMYQVSYVNGTQFTSQVTEDLAGRLSKLASSMGKYRSTFLCSGSEAVEAAAKFVRQLWVERGKPERYKLIARMPSYHGNTLYALSASGRPRYKKYFGPLLHDVVIIPAPYEYRSPVSDYHRLGTDHYCEHLEKAIEQEGPDSIAAFIFEPIIGSSAGGSVPPDGYFKKVQEICKKHGILMIADEILCGSGRTGKFFASEHFGLKPDVILLGKGINGGYVPLSVLLAQESYVNEMKAGSGGFMHAQTYMQSPSMTSAGLAILDYFEKHQVLENCKQRGELLHQLLTKEILPHPNVGFTTGKGLLAGVEIVEDKKTKKPFDRTRKVTEGLTELAFQNGLIVWPNMGQADGTHGDLLLLGPPLNVTDQQIREIVDSLKNVIQTYFKI